MKKTVIGIIVAAVVLYMWGFLYWGIGNEFYATKIWKHAADDEATGDVLREHFPENGTYLVPGYEADVTKAEALYKKGPVAFVHMLHISGREMMDPTIMINGFLLNLVVIIMIAMLLRQVAPALPSFAAKAKFSALAGLTAAVLIDCGDAVWWQIDWSWKLYNAFYDFSAWLITGVVLSWFLSSESTDETPAAS